MDRRHMSFSRAVSATVPREARSRVLWSCPAAGPLDVGPSRRSPPGRIHPHNRRPRMGKLALLALAVLALGLVPVPAQAQRREVTGRVTRALGDVPVGLATITEVGGQGVAQSGADGTFRVIVAAGDVRLLVRAVGYQREEVPVTARESNMVGQLAEEPLKLEAGAGARPATTPAAPAPAPAAP